jgi:glycerol-3-phosphate acyltransferase PlsX
VSASLAISLDAMGGDNAPEMVIRGADIATQRFPTAHFLFFGDEQRIKPMIERLPGLSAVSAVRHAETEVKMEDKPSQALRAGRKSSMRLAIERS